VVALQAQAAVGQQAELLIQVVVVVVVDILEAYQVQVAQVLLLFLTQAHSVVLAVQLHLLVATLFIHLHHLAHIRLNRRKTWDILQK
jgi:hypothetical protein